MKALKITILAIISFSVFTVHSYCDVGPLSYFLSSASFDETISNIDEFPGISFIAYFYHLRPKEVIAITLIKQNQPFINKYPYRARMCDIYAVKTSSIEGKDLNNTDFPTDPNFVKLYKDLRLIRDTPSLLHSPELEGCKGVSFIYTILGFRNGKLIIYKSKEIYKYGFFSADKTVTLEKPDTTGITKNID